MPISLDFNKLKEKLTPIEPGKFTEEEYRQVWVGVINALLFWSGVVVMAAIIISGFMYITAAGNADQAEKAKKSLIGAVFGEIVIIAAYIIFALLRKNLGGEPTS